jgi:hypothetical protein
MGDIRRAMENIRHSKIKAWQHVAAIDPMLAIVSYQSHDATMDLNGFKVRVDNPDHFDASTEILAHLFVDLSHFVR